MGGAARDHRLHVCGAFGDAFRVGITILRVTKFSRRRQVERVRLGAPLRGRMGGVEGVVLDLSLVGCRLEHHAPLKIGSESRLHLQTGDGEIEIDCRVVRSALDPTFMQHEGTMYESGLRFIRSAGDGGDALRRLISMHVMYALEEQKANAHGDIPKFLLDALKAAASPTLEFYSTLPFLRVARGRGYVSYVLEEKVWKRRRTQNPSQPPEGFTVWAYEDPDQLEQLAETYLRADAETRTMIRICAELSLVIDDTIPPQRFLP